MIILVLGLALIVCKGQILRSTSNTAPLLAALVTLSRKVF